MSRIIRAVDLFAGAGGASTGLQLAATSLGYTLDLCAINHWPAAVQTHARNHPNARHLCETVERVDPRDVVPGGHLDLLVAGPECVFFSQARGGKPIDDQRRSSAWSILRWLELLTVDRVLIENVPEFRKWAPLNRQQKPIKAKQGQIFRAFIGAIESMGYTVEYREIVAADHGEATTRKRLFIQAARGRRRIVWPDRTHAPRKAAPSLLTPTALWRGAREIIDWSLPSGSIFDRKKPLSANTMRRIQIGLQRFGGKPFVLGQQGGGAPRPTDEPLPTVTADGYVAMIEPFVVSLTGTEGSHLERSATSLDEPLRTIRASGTHHALVEPFVMPYCSNGGQLARPVTEPVGTITTKQRLALVIPEGVDVRFRMLQPHELSAAMGFPEDYQFVGTKTDTVRMIGNAWSVRTAEALCQTLLANIGAALAVDVDAESVA